MRRPSRIQKLNKMAVHSDKFSLKTMQRKQKRRPMPSLPLPKKRPELRRRKLTKLKLKRIGLRKQNRLLPRGNASKLSRLDRKEKRLQSLIRRE